MILVKLHNKDVKIIALSLLALAVLFIIMSAPEVFGRPGGMPSDDREYNCGGDSCHNDDQSASSITMDTSDPDPEPGEELTVDVTVSGAEASSSPMGVFLLKRLETSESMPSEDGWVIVSDPGGSTTYNFYKKEGITGGGTWTWTLKAPQETGSYHLYAREHHGDDTSTPYWRNNASGLEFTVADTTPPAKVTDLTASDPTEDSIDLTWTAPGDDGDEGGVDGYELKYSSSEEITEENWDLAMNYTQSWTPLTAGENEHHTITGLEGETRYWFAIKAYDDAENYGDVSNSPNASTKGEPEPKGPVNLTLTPEAVNMEEKSQENHTLFVEYQGEPLEGATATVVPELGFVTGLNETSPGNHSFNYKAPEVDRNRTEYLNITVEKEGYVTSYLNTTFTITNNITLPEDETPPAAVQDLTVIGTNDSSVTLSWTAPGDDGDAGRAARYHIRYSASGGITEEMWDEATSYQQNLVPLEAGEIEQLVVAGLQRNTSYWFAIRAEDDAGNLAGGSGSPEGRTNLSSPLVLALRPVITELEESASRKFTLSINIQELDITGLIGVSSSIIHGQVSVGAKYGGGPLSYDIMYTAPDIETNTTEYLNITVRTDGFENAYLNITFTLVNKEQEPELDGIVSPDEYPFNARFKGGDFVVHWRVEDDTIFMALVGETDGWVAIGFEPTKAMKDADMIFGWVSSGGEVNVVDAYSTGTNGPHPPDTDLGGTDDILAFGGTKEGGTTTIEFKRLLSTGDSYDKTIPKDGEVDIIWGTGPSDSFTSKHGSKGSGRLDIATGAAEEDDDVKLWPVHATLLILGFFSMVTGVFVAMFKRKEKWWLKLHKNLGLAGATLTVLGLFMGLYMVEEATGVHFRVPHAFLGVITIIFVVTTLLLRFLAMSMKERGKQLMGFHRWSGRITLILMIMAIISGLSVAGVL